MADELVFGLVPVHDDEETRAGLAHITLALGEALGRPVVERRAASPDALARAWGSGTIDLAWVSPALALTAPEMRGAVPAVSSVRQGVASYHGVLFVRRDSPIASPLGLRRARAAWVAPTSAGGYIFPRVALAGHGVDPAGLFAEESFLGSHGAVARAVRDGDADVGATFAVFEGGDATAPLVRAGFTDLEGGGWARILLPTPPIPADLLVASPGLAREVGLDRLRAALRALPLVAPEAVRHVLGADSFVACDERSLEDLRRQLDDARVLGVLG